VVYEAIEKVPTTRKEASGVQLRKQLEEQAAALAAAQVVGALPTRVDLSIYQGDDFFLTVAVSGSGAIDLTTFTPKSQIKSNPGAPSVIASFTATVKDPTTIVLHLASAQSTLLPSTASWDLQITDTNGLVTTLCYGQISTSREVTT